MDWFVTNWFSILIFIAFIAMHFVMHTGHGGHGGAGHHHNEVDVEKEDSKVRDVDRGSSGHRH